MFHLRFTPARWLLLGVGALLMVAAPVERAWTQEVDRVHPGEAPGFLSEPQVIAKGIDFAMRTIGDGGSSGEVKNGFYPEMSAMVTGAGWISMGPGYRHWLFGDRTLFDVSAGYSWRGYKAAQARFELPRLFKSRLTLGTQYRWQDLTQISYFGEGAESPQADRSEYRLTSHNVVGYATVMTTRWLSIRGRGGWLPSPNLGDPAGHFKRGNPSTLAVFASDPALLQGTQPNFLHGDVSLVADTRDSRNHPVHGGVYRASWGTYSDRGTGAFTFQRYEVEAAHFVPMLAERIVLAVRGWSAMTDTSGNSTVPFYMLPSLGGNNTLRSFTDYRFHDRHMVVANAEARVALFTHLDGAVFVDAGNVASRVRDLNLDRRSYGFGIRMHSSRRTFARVDVAHGSEGWRFLFRLNDPLRLRRLSVRTASMPFVP